MGIDLEGRSITAFRPMTQQELGAEMWDVTHEGPPYVIELDNGTIIFPSRDSEGNGPGCFFGTTAEGHLIRF